MELLTEDLKVLADEIARTFRTGPITRLQVSDVGRLANRLEQEGARTVKASQYDDRMDFTGDEQVFAQNTTPEFWASNSFLLGAPVSFESGPFGGRCFVVPGPTTASEVLVFYYANVREKLFEVDTVMLARSSGQLLIATHYGTVLLFEPRPAGRSDTGSGASEPRD